MAESEARPIAPSKPCHHTRHLWRNVGPAPESHGEPCVLWRCDGCGKEHETFADCRPMSGKFVGGPSDG